MTSYYDPINDNDQELTESTILYFVSTEKNFSIKGISSGLEKLASDPTSHALEFWPIETSMILAKKDDPILFPNEKLTTEALPLETWKSILGFDPTASTVQKFDAQIGLNLSGQWGFDTLRDNMIQASTLANYTLGETLHHSQHPQSFFTPGRLYCPTPINQQQQRADKTLAYINNNY